MPSNVNTVLFVIKFKFYLCCLYLLAYVGVHHNCHYKWWNAVLSLFMTYHCICS